MRILTGGPKYMDRVYVTLIMGVFLHSGLSHAADTDPCESSDPVGQPFSFTLQRAYSGEHGFMGIFEIENRSAKAVDIPGRKTGTDFTSGRPEVTVEFKDIAPSWQPLLALPGSFLSRPDRLTIPPGGKGRVTIYLMSEGTANQGASQYRVLLRLFASSTCIVSAPFTSLPRRAPVTGFESLPQLE